MMRRGTHSNSNIPFRGIILPILGAFAVLGCPNPAQALSVTPVFGYAHSLGAIYGSSGTSTGFRPLSLMFGLLWEGKISSQLGLEIGILYGPRGLIQTVNDVVSTVTFTTLQAPIVLRWQVIPTLKLAFGGYYSYGYGPYKVIQDGNEATYTYGPGNYAGTDLGGVLSASLCIKLISFISWVADARYLLGFTNISPQNSFSTYLRDFQFLTGIRIGN